MKPSDWCWAVTTTRGGRRITCAWPPCPRVGGRVESQVNGLGERVDTGGQFACDDMENVMALLREHGYPTLVHGHTHRPDCHRLPIDGRDCVRHVLADWHGAARWLAFDGTRFTTDGASAAA